MLSDNAAIFDKFYIFVLSFSLYNLDTVLNLLLSGYVLLKLIICYVF